MSAPLLDELSDVAYTAAMAGCGVLVAGLGSVHTDVSTKSSPTDMVTEMDRASEECIVSVLIERRPDDAIMAEEGAAKAGTTGVRWVVDPLDGTTNYLFGVPAFAVSVAAEVNGTTAVGVVADPSRGEIWRAVRGSGSFLNDRAIRLAPGPVALDEALVATGFSYLSERRAEQGRQLAGLLPRVRDIRRFGAAALDLCWVAGSRFSAFYEWGLQPWDLAAGRLIAEEAGAQVALLKDGTVLVSAPRLLQPLRDLLAGGPNRP